MRKVKPQASAEAVPLETKEPAPVMHVPVFAKTVHVPRNSEVVYCEFFRLSGQLKISVGERVVPRKVVKSVDRKRSIMVMDRNWVNANALPIVV